ncbi:acetyl-CoA carboxylase, biotin carboxyl carrier protein [Syntrophotalea acetylenivorans]|uniref:Biotin carboxyl carrier protein of acetyl-CoA carboxylase n=1 Tax=Syntrophotalea acetylenivorans TaxID=1842532 RepID=A0A1L3GST8_9BACT|nr:acetyl-CoA carboxylase biotin carboxyl carrier protein [Syntrophotalea acetylenivorans]APG28930.1 acetyl-CoA carboxylase, biotin carboxyl carrier protein [Syntrophotalea acetylenivorans]
MDIKNIKSLIRMVTQTDITEFELESDGEKLVIRRGSQVVTTSMPVAPMPVAAPAVSAAPVAVPVAPAEAEAVDDGLEEVTSPIVGTFYRSPSPESDSYVEVGSVVEKGQTLCIVEAMKLMNEIEAEYKCKVVKILKENAEPVEYGDSLFLVEPL